MAAPVTAANVEYMDEIECLLLLALITLPRAAYLLSSSVRVMTDFRFCAADDDETEAAMVVVFVVVFALPLFNRSCDEAR